MSLAKADGPGPYSRPIDLGVLPCELDGITVTPYQIPN